jgi:hypothetical protein
LLYIVIRGLAEADSFDLLLPLWSIVLITVLAGHEAEAGSAPAESHLLSKRISARPCPQT